MRRVPRPTRSLRRAASCWLALALSSAPVVAPASEVDELERWVPSVAAFLGVMSQGGEGAITTSDVLGPPLTEGGCLDRNRGTRNGGLCPGSPLELIPNTRSSDTAVTALVGGSAELMTPRLFDALLSPRLFVHGDAMAAFAFDRNLAGERSPGRFVPQELDPNVSDPSEVAVKGQGSRVNTRVQPLALAAGAGVAFTADVFQRTVRIKPSVEYLYQEVKLTGELRRAVKLEEDFDASDDGELADFRLVAFRQTDIERQHGFGGGLEIEADSGRIGAFALSVFFLGRGYRIVGDTDFSLSQVNEFGEMATWDIELDPWVWRAGLGLRFRYLPE